MLLTILIEKYELQIFTYGKDPQQLKDYEVDTLKKQQHDSALIIIFWAK
jgi:hypothetical protein